MKLAATFRLRSLRRLKPDAAKIMDIRTILPSLIVSPTDIKRAELIEGEILRAGVKDILPDGKVKLSLKGFIIEARTEVALKTGDTITATVESSGGKIILRLAAPPETNKILESIKMLLPEKADVGKLIEKILLLEKSGGGISNNADKANGSLKALKEFLGRILIEGNGLNENAVKNIIEKGGQFYEESIKKAVMSGIIKPDDAARLAKDDLKPIVMSIVKELEQGVFKDAQKDLLKTASGLLKNIELNQFMNAAQAKHDSAAYFQIPFYFKDNLETAELFFFGGKKGAGGKAKKDFSIAVSLNMKALGQVVADARVRSDDVFLRIYAGDKESSEFIREHLDMLKNGIESKGMRVGSIDCMVGKKQDVDKLFSRISRNFKMGLVDEFA